MASSSYLLAEIAECAARANHLDFTSWFASPPSTKILEKSLEAISAPVRQHDLECSKRDAVIRP